MSLLLTIVTGGLLTLLGGATITFFENLEKASFSAQTLITTSAHTRPNVQLRVRTRGMGWVFVFIRVRRVKGGEKEGY
jgi:hypothetical protein